MDCTDCGITDEGAIELGRTIYLNGNLCNLYLGFNCIGHIGVAIISQSLRMAGPGVYCPPPHPTHFQPLSLE
jgi:hypothetical protein